MFCEIKKGIKTPFECGQVLSEIYDGPPIKRVAIIGPDSPGMRPTMLVKEGEQVEKGQKLFEDKKNLGVFYTASMGGKISKIERGDKRTFLSVSIDVEENGAEKSFDSFSYSQLSNLSADEIKKNLLESGLWTALRTRPYAKVPSPTQVPAAIFIRAMDTNPMAPIPELIIKEREEDFKAGVTVLSSLCHGTTYVCHASDYTPPQISASSTRYAAFKGFHPAGNSGTHIHHLYPANNERIVWYLDYQDVMNIGSLFLTGKLNSSRVISVGIFGDKNPVKMYKTVMGASISSFVEDVLNKEPSFLSGQMRVLSGSVFHGRDARENHFSYLGRYHHQITALRDHSPREFLGWMAPGLNKYSLFNVFASKLIPGKKFAFTASKQGSLRSMVPIGAYERVFPFLTEPTHLLRAIMSGDTDSAQELGILELDEEDIGICTFVCPCKIDYAPKLREVLTKIEKDG